MKQLEVISWKTLDALKDNASKVVEIVGDLDTDEQMSVFCIIDEDYLELYYNEMESNIIRHFEDEDEFYKYIKIRKKEIGEDDYEGIDFYDEDDFGDDKTDEDFDGYDIKDDDVY